MKKDDRLTMAHKGMDGENLTSGDRVELHPGLDLWMRGARYGTIQKITPEGVAVVRMDNKSVRKLQKISTGRLKLMRDSNPKRRRKKAATKKVARHRVRKNPDKKPLTGFQVAALRQGKILFLSGIGLSDNRAAASNFTGVATARHVAKQVRSAGRALGISKVAVVTKHDSPHDIRSFLLGEARGAAGKTR